MSNGVSWAGDNGSDVSQNVSSTSPGNVGMGGSKGIEFPGKVGEDVKHSMESTKPPKGEMPGGKGEIEFTPDVGY